MNFIKDALNSAIDDGCIIPELVNKYIDIFSSDRRYKLKWLAADCYKNGCSSGIIRYMNREYYFSLSGSKLNVE